MRTDFRLITNPIIDSFFSPNVAIIVATFVGKMVACFVPYVCYKMPLKDAIALALVMCSKGVVQLCFYADFRDVLQVIIYYHCCILRLIFKYIILNLCYAPVILYSYYVAGYYN